MIAAKSWYPNGLYLCVLVKILPADAFVLTAYLTDKVKQGERLWPISE